MKKSRREARRKFKRLWQKRLWKARRAYMRLFGNTRLFDKHLKPLIREEITRIAGGGSR